MVDDVYFLTVHDPLDMDGAPAPVTAMIVHAKTFLHPDLPQPASASIYRCLTEFPGRTPGCLVPLSTLHYELDDGRLWPQVGDWQGVVRALLTLARIPGGSAESMPLALPPAETALLASGPHSAIRAYGPGGPMIFGTSERNALIRDLTASLPTATGGRPLWPGDNLIEPSCEPRTMPYQPHGT